jgi:hypothetical protein
MKNSRIDIYILIFSSIVLFASLVFFIIIFFNHYRKKQRKNYLEKEELKAAFQRELLRSQLEIQEETFNHISQEIHDNVGQILSLAKVQINIMNETSDLNHEMLNEVKENVGKALSDLRDIARSLNSEHIRSVSILKSVTMEAERINKSGVGSMLIHIDGEERMINVQKKLILFRIIQESIQNCIKHATASQINISFFYTPAELMVQIADNGRGFDIDGEVQKGNGIGLMNIKKRAVLAGGSSSIESRINAGTTIQISMPYE